MTNINHIFVLEDKSKLKDLLDSQSIQLNEEKL